MIKIMSWIYDMLLKIYNFKLNFFLGIRDYIHVMDLAVGHVAALSKLNNNHLRLKASV